MNIKFGNHILLKTISKSKEAGLCNYRFKASPRFSPTRPV